MLSRLSSDHNLIDNAGRKNIIENNIFVDFQHPASFGCPPHLNDHRVYEYMAGNRVIRNIFYSTRENASLRPVHIGSGHGMFRTIEEKRRIIAESDYNLFFGGSRGDYAQLEEWQELGFDSHSVIADPLFVAPEQDDYRLKPETPALKLGFQPIDVTKIGIRDTTSKSKR